MENSIADKEVQRAERVRLLKARSDVQQAINDFVDRRGTKIKPLDLLLVVVLDWFGWRRIVQYTLVDYTNSYREYLIRINEFGGLHKDYYWRSIKSFSAVELERMLPRIKSL